MTKHTSYLHTKNKENEKWVAILDVADEEIAFQSEEKEKCAAELAIADKKLVFQNEEKEKWVAILAVTDEELSFQNEEKEKRAAELAVANKELAFQNKEKEKRAAELAIANKELAFQNEEKEKRAAELATANESIASQLKNIQALQRIDRAILGSQDLNLTLHVVLEQTRAELNVDAAAILLLSRYSKNFEFVAGIGICGKAIERSRLQLDERLGGRAALDEGVMSVTDPADNSGKFVRTSLLADEGFATYFSAPIIFKGRVRGVLEVFHRSPFTPDQDWLNFLEILAGQTAIAVDSASVLAKLQSATTQNGTGAVIRKG